MKKADNKTSKNTEKTGQKKVIMAKTVTALKSETAHFIIGLFCVIFGVYLVLAFCSFFFTGGNDQSILDHPNHGELLSTNNHIQNYAGAKGAQAAEFLINDCFGIPAFLIKPTTLT